MSEIVNRFAIADHNDDIPAAVQVARDVVKQAFLRGELEADVPALARLLMGDVDHQGVMTAEAWALSCQFMLAAFAMGVALGQLTHPDLFA
jgi:hypothetical protein